MTEEEKIALKEEMKKERIARRQERKEERQAKIKLEKEKLRDMKSFKDKADYIWEYYRLPIVSGIFILIIIGYIVNITIINPPDKTGVGIAFTHIMSDEERENSLKVNSEQAINIGEGYEVSINAVPIGLSQDVTYEQGMQQKILAMIVTGEIDLIIGVNEFFYQNATESIFLDIGEVLSDNKYDGLRDKFITGLLPKEMVSPEIVAKSEIVEHPSPLDNTDITECIERPVAIKLNDCKVLKDLGYPVDGISIAFISTSKRPEMTLKLFDYIMGIE